MALPPPLERWSLPNDERWEVNVKWLSGLAWLDDDGRHIWFRHDCVEGTVTTMLPDTWRVDEKGYVRPSVQCDACGLHDASLTVSKRGVARDD